MKSRCYNQNNKRYENYGHKGIKVCEEWLDFNVFYQWSLKSGYNDTMTIERNDIEKVIIQKIVVGYHLMNKRIIEIELFGLNGMVKTKFETMVRRIRY